MTASYLFELLSGVFGELSSTTELRWMIGLGKCLIDDHGAFPMIGLCARECHFSPDAARVVAPRSGRLGRVEYASPHSRDRLGGRDALRHGGIERLRARRIGCVGHFGRGDAGEQLSAACSGML